MSGGPSTSPTLVGVLFAGAGTLHFAAPEAYEAIVPDYLPYHRALVLISGAAEIAGGIGLMLPATRRAAGWGLVALLVAVLPANVQMALHPAPVRGVRIPPALLWARLPLQAVFADRVLRAAAWRR